MKSAYSFLAALLFLSVNCINSQTVFKDGAGFCSYLKSNSHHFYDMYGKSMYGSNHTFDALDYKIYLDLYDCYRSPFPYSFSANVTIKFKVDSMLNKIRLNAVNSSLIIDSVKLAGVSFTHSNNVLTINLDRNYNQGELSNVQIYYRHKNVYDTAFFNISGVVLTDCEPFGARSWFPCWDMPNDKATLDLTAKVPLIVKLGSNGRLNDSLISGDTIYYHWISRDPAPTYAMSIVSRPYYNLDILYWHKLSNPADSVPIRMYWNFGENQDSINNIKSIILPLADFYSSSFVEHPFEKNGFASPGQDFWGMENQTLTTMSSSWREIQVSHEFAHQWFGDMITCGTWADIWLNEGFATYCDALWIEHRKGYAAYKSVIQGYADFVFRYPSGLPVYNPSWITNPPPKYQIFDGTITYYKPACILSMLRYVTGDSTFFRIMNAYASDTTYKYKNAVTADFIGKVNQVAGQNHDWFFDQWIFKPNYPKYQNSYVVTQLDSLNWKVQFTARQVQPNPPFFKMPIELKFYFGIHDTIVTKVLNDQNNQLFEFNFNKRPLVVIFDPYNNIVLKEATTSIGVENISTIVPGKYNLFQNYPNPFNSSTIIKFDLAKPGNTELVLYDIQGREVEIPVNQYLDAGSYMVKLSSENLASGFYIYRIISGNFIETRKLVIIK